MQKGLRQRCWKARVARLEAPLARPKSNAGRAAANVAWSFGCCAANPVDAVSREVGVTIAELEQWRELALAGMEAGLKTRTSDPRKPGSMTLCDAWASCPMENEILRKERELQTPSPFDHSEIVDMSHTISVSAGRPFGLQRVCQVLELPRSTIYAVRARASACVAPMAPRRRGPKPKMPDADLLQAIRDDLAASPFIGEGHRKGLGRGCASCATSASPGPAYCG